MTKEKSALDKLKKDYAKLHKKYKLPSYEDLNIFFDIEELAAKETDMLLRNIRRKITEKTNSYLRFAEIFLNPQQAPLFFMILGKNLSVEGRKTLNDMYIDLGIIELKHFRGETKYSEKSEAKTIKEVFKIWKGINEKSLILADLFDESWEKKAESNNKSYLG